MGKWWSKEESAELKETEIINVKGNGNTVYTEHLAHLQNISIAVSIVAVILVAIVLFFIVRKCMDYSRKRQQKIIQKALARGL